MGITFITTVKTLVRQRDTLLWAIAFPLVLCTLIYAMLGNLDEAYALKPVEIVVVDDAAYQATTGLPEMITALSKDTVAEGDTAIFDTTYVDSDEAARQALTDGDYTGFITVDATGQPAFHVDARYASSTTGTNASIVKIVLDQYWQTASLVGAMAQTDPSLFTDPALLERLTTEVSYTQRVSVTANPPSDSLAYMYSALAFSVIMMMSFALAAVEDIQANTSALGARRSLAGQSKARTLAPAIAASWVVGFGVQLVGYSYVKFAFGTSFGGKDPAVLLTLAVGVLAMTFTGAFVGSLPISSGAKSGITATLSCFLSLFAGLYGPFAQDLAESAAENAPLFALANPARQVTQAFHALYYYDGYQQFFQAILALLGLAAVFFVLSTLMLRRKRYASL
ncbi:MAG: ABC transporter permease [Bifidobacteriaceae bacterium]|jgi:ABC-type multidrug transport system permease subunit|nr:ABC transporter permease [Bifidobacteriaceae bacterium]